MAASVGFRGRVVMNGLTLRAIKWVLSAKTMGEDDVTVSLDPVVLALTNKLRARALPFIPPIIVTTGLIRWDVSIDALWFTEDNPFTLDFPILPSLDVIQMDLFINKSNTQPTWSFIAGLVNSVEMTHALRDVNRYSITATCWNCVRYPF